MYADANLEELLKVEVSHHELEKLRNRILKVEELLQAGAEQQVARQPVRNEHRHQNHQEMREIGNLAK